MNQMMKMPLWLRQIIILAVFGAMFAMCAAPVIKGPDWLEPATFQSGLRMLETGERQSLVTTVAGEEVQVMVVNFWASWCDVCELEQPELNQAYHEFVKQYGDEVLFVGVNVGESENVVRRYIKKHDVPYLMMLGWSGSPAPNGALPYTAIVIRISSGWETYYEMPRGTTFAELDIVVADAVAEAARRNR